MNSVYKLIFDTGEVVYITANGRKTAMNIYCQQHGVSREWCEAHCKVVNMGLAAATKGEQMMTRIEAYHILHDMWKDADEKQREAIDIAQNDIEFVDLMPEEIINKFNYGIKTNADHIRSMSDEELACYLALIEDLKSGAIGFTDTSGKWLEWLKQPKEKEE